MSIADEVTIRAAGGYGPPGGGYGGPPPGGYGGAPPGGYGGPPPPGGGPPGGPPPGAGYGGPGGFGAPPPNAPGAGYGPAGPGAGGPRLHPLAIVSIAAGVLSIPACCCWFFGFPLPICAIVCGFLALTKIRSEPQRYSGAVLCYIGIACGVLGFFMSSGFHLTSYGNVFRHRYGRVF